MACTEEKSVLTIQHVQESDRIQSFSVSPDGFRVAYSVRTHSLKDSADAYRFWLASTSHDPNPLAEPILVLSDGGPFLELTWLDESGTQLGYLSPDDGINALRQLDLTDCLDRKSPEEACTPHVVASFPVSIDTLRFNFKKSRLVFSAAVFPEKTLAETGEILAARKKDPPGMFVYDTLYVRHWDTFEDGTKNHLFVVDLARDEDGIFKANAEPVDILFGKPNNSPIKPFGGASDYSISPDGGKIVYSTMSSDGESRVAWNTDSNIFEYSVKNGVTKQLTFTDAYSQHPVWSPSGRYVAYTQMEVPKFEADRARVAVYDTATGKNIILTEHEDISFDELTWSTTDDAIYATAPFYGDVSIFKVENGGTSSAVELLVHKNQNSGVQVTPQGTLVFSKDSMMRPAEIYELSKVSGKPKALTQLNEARFSSIPLSPYEPFDFANENGVKVHGFFIRPPNFDANKKYPVAYLIHGGPQSAWLDNWSYRWNPQVFAGAGFVVALVNPTGSIGYGQEFTNGVTNDWGGVPFRDLITGIKHVTSTYAFADENRMVALGASYGGFMINWMNGEAELKGKFKAFVNHDGVFDQVMMYYGTEELFFMEHENGGVPEYENAAAYEKWNPRTRVANWHTPTLVIQGGKDFRIPEDQGLGTFTALQRLGIESKLLYFPEENHWVIKPSNSVSWYREVLGWIVKHTSS